MKNVTTYTEKTYQKIDLFNGFSKDAMFYKSTTIAVLMLIGSRIVYKNNQNTFGWVLCGISCIVLPLWFIVLPLINHKFSYKKSLKVNNGKEFVNEIELDTYELITHNNIGQKFVIKYKNVSRIADNSKLIVVYPNKGQKVYMDKEGFVDCTAEEAMDFLQKKCPDAFFKHNNY